MEQDKIHRFVECTVPISNCNLKCEYCYVIQENRRNTKTNSFLLKPREIGKAFSQKRWGGVMLVNLCGFGETLIPKQMPDIIYYILNEGHYINVTNNGTQTERFNEIIKYPKEMLSRLSFSFSLHYVELKKKGLLEVFAENAKKVREAGCSYLIQINLCDTYIELKDEITEYCLKNFNALPQVALTRDETKSKEEFYIYSQRTNEEYFEEGRKYHSPLFEFTLKNFNVKRTEFCYAGDWSFKLDLASGDLRSCYFTRPHYNIYDDLNEEIPINTVGENCGWKYCINSSHFMSLGVIPSVDTPTYGALRNREEANWYSKTMISFLESKFNESNDEYSEETQRIITKKFYTWHNRVGEGKYPYLFPCDALPENAEIVLYGAGKVGRCYYAQAKENYKIISWVDCNFENIDMSGEKNIKIESPDKIKELEFDFVVIGILNEDIIKEVSEKLQKMGVNKDKIIY